MKIEIEVPDAHIECCLNGAHIRHGGRMRWQTGIADAGERVWADADDGALYYGTPERILR